MSDGSISFDTKIDNEHFQDGIKDIQKRLNNVVGSINKMSKTTKQAWDGMSSEQVALMNRIDQSKNKIDELKNKITEIENQKVPTKQFVKLHEKVKNLKLEYSKLVEEEKKMKSFTGYNAKSKSAQELSNKVKQARIELNKYALQEDKMKQSGQAYTVQGQTSESSAMKVKLAGEEVNFIKLNKQLDELKAKEEKTSDSTKKISKSMKESKVSAGGLAKSLLKISTMLKARVLYSLVDVMVKGAKEGFNNLVQYSSKLNTSVSGLKSSFTQLGNSLATVFSPIIQSITPILQNVINKIIEAINVMAQFTARIFGNATTFTKAKKINEDYAKSLGKTSKKQKQFASFDTVEQLSKKDSDNGSINPSEMFEEAKIESSVINIVDTLKNKLSEFVSWIGKEFGTQFQSLLPDFSRNIATLETNILKMWNKLGKLKSPIFNWFNNDFLTFLHQFVETAGTIINGLFETFNLVFDSIFNLVIMPSLNTFFTYVLPFLTQLATQITATIDTLFTTINNLFQKLWVEGVEPVLKLLAQIWNDLWASVKSAWDKWGEPIFDNIRLAIENIGTTLSLVWDNILQPIWDNFMTIIEELWNNHLKPLWDNILDFIGGLINGALEIYNGFISPIVNWLVEILGPIFANVFNTISTIIGSTIGAMIDSINGLITMLKGVIEFIVGVFTGDWNKAWNGIKTAFGGLWDGIVNIVKGAINLIIDFINGMITGVETALNWVIEKINMLSWDVPEWVPGIGGETWGFDIPLVEFGRIPRLATGTVVPANYGEFAAILGDNKRETEVVSPLSTIKQALIEAMQEMGFTGSGDATIILELDGNELGRAVYKLNKRESRRIGVSTRVTGGAY